VDTRIERGRVRAVRYAEKLHLQYKQKSIIGDDMKRFVLTVIVAAFAVAAQAGDAKSCQEKCTAKDKPACCPSKVKVSTEAKGGACPMAKSAACTKQTAPKQSVLASPKAADAAK
jgi:hypothetical protein